MWHEGSAPAPVPAEDDESDDSEIEEADKAAAVPGAAAAAGAAAAKAAASGSGAAASDDPDGKEVRHGNKKLQELHKRCHNTLYVAANILARSELQELPKLVFVLCGPLYDEHSDQAAEARAPDSVMAHYLQQAEGAYERPLRKSFSFLRDEPTMRYCGFTTEFSSFTAATKAKNEALLTAEGAPLEGVAQGGAIKTPKSKIRHLPSLIYLLSASDNLNTHPVHPTQLVEIKLLRAAPRMLSHIKVPM